VQLSLGIDDAAAPRQLEGLGLYADSGVRGRPKADLRDGLTYLRCVSGELLDVDPAEPLTEAPGTGTFAAMEPDDQAQDGILSNDDDGLEREADVMWVKARSDSEQ
jgi:hypothetical protein